jgi:hypothetical protein
MLESLEHTRIMQQYTRAGSAGNISDSRKSKKRKRTREKRHQQ